MSPDTTRAAAPSAMAPFGHRAFTLLWVATVVSNIGTWMNDVGAGWLMTELSPSPLMVAAVQSATTLPVFLFALVAGALADIVDRRRLLLTVNLAMALAATLLAILVQFGLMTPSLLLLFTFLFGTGAAFMAPAWQAVVPALVPRSELSSAIALNSMGINVSRAIGPALAGVLIVAAGLAAPFAVNAASFVAILAALLWWRPHAEEKTGLPPERVFGAVRLGLSFAAASRPLRATVTRAAAFFIFASAFWAMLPLIARDVLAGGPTLYGLLMGAVGAGAVLGALALPVLKARWGADGTVAAGTIGTALVLVLLAVVPVQGVALAAAAVAGVSWIAVLSSLNVSAQTALPDWVRARGLSIYLTVFFGAMAMGSLLWGQVAASFGISGALLVAAAGALAMLPLVTRFRLSEGAAINHVPSMHWPVPILFDGADAAKGPVIIRVEYRVGAPERAAFAQLMTELSSSRRRGGGYRWTLMQDAADPNRFVEEWLEGSWLDHQRHHARVSEADRALQQKIAELLGLDASPPAEHFLTPRLSP